MQTLEEDEFHRQPQSISQGEMQAIVLHRAGPSSCTNYLEGVYMLGSADLAASPTFGKPRPLQKAYSFCLFGRATTGYLWMPFIQQVCCTTTKFTVFKQWCRDEKRWWVERESVIRPPLQWGLHRGVLTCCSSWVGKQMANAQTAAAPSLHLPPPTLPEQTSWSIFLNTKPPRFIPEIEQVSQLTVCVSH